MYLAHEITLRQLAGAETRPYREREAIAAALDELYELRRESAARVAEAERLLAARDARIRDLEAQVGDFNAFLRRMVASASPGNGWPPVPGRLEGFPWS